MRAVVFLVLGGCAQLFDLERPQHEGEPGEPGEPGDPGASAPDAAAPPARCIIDRFDDSVIDPMWTLARQRHHVAELGGQFEIRYALQTADTAGIRLSDELDLRDRVIQVEMVDPPDGDNVDMYMALYGSDSTYGEFRAVIRFYDEQLQLRMQAAGTENNKSMLFQPSTQRHWRVTIDGAARTAKFAVSSTGTSWTTHHTATWPFSLARVELISSTFLTGNLQQNDRAAFDNFQIRTANCVE